MRSTTLIISFLGVALAAPKGDTKPKKSNLDHLCKGADANCEVVTNRHGYQSVRFKEGMGPGSDDYISRVGKDGKRGKVGKKMKAKANGDKSKRYNEDNTVKDEWDTYITMGATEMPWWCGDPNGFSIESTIGDAMGELCSNVACDEGSDHRVDSAFVKNKQLVTGEIVITAEGSYPPPMENAYVDALKVIPNADSVSSKEMGYTAFGGVSTTWEHCVQKRFPNYIMVTHMDDDNTIIGTMEMNAAFEADDPGNACEIVTSVGGALAGMVSGVGAGFFGIVGAICGASEGGDDE